MSVVQEHMQWVRLLDVTGPFLSLKVIQGVFPQGLDRHSVTGRELRVKYDEWQGAVNQAKSSGLLEKRSTEEILAQRANNRKTRRKQVAPDVLLSLEQRYQQLELAHKNWVRYVLKEVLHLDATVLIENVPVKNIRGNEALDTTNISEIVGNSGKKRTYDNYLVDAVVINPSGWEQDARRPRLIVQVMPYNQALDKGYKNKELIIGDIWHTTPQIQMMELLRRTKVKLGLLTNGEQWTLVHAAAGETTSFISWHSWLWLDDPLSLRSFYSLLSAKRFFTHDRETLEALFVESANDQYEVTEQLGYQVRQAVATLVKKFDELKKDQDNRYLAAQDEKQLYEAALTVMMRLVFLMCAEEKGLLPLNNEVYSGYYAISTLRDRLRSAADQRGEVVLEYFHDAWARLLATFRIVHAGVDHPRLFLPAYDSSLFDPDKYPFLEGRAVGSGWGAARALHVDNRTVLELLEALQVLEIKVPGSDSAEPRILSFQSLDIEQIGHVYEGLLDHTAVSAAELMVGLKGAKDREIELPLSELEPWSASLLALKNSKKATNSSSTTTSEHPAQKSKTTAALLDLLEEKTGRSRSALEKDLTPASLNSQEMMLFSDACNNDPSLRARIEPFIGLLRKDLRGYPVVLTKGTVYVSKGSDRRATGTHYTPRSLTQSIVQYTLEPLIYRGPAEGWPREQWQLKPAAELLQLKICDFAMGSGAFLVQACRYLAERLVEAWDREDENATTRALEIEETRRQQELLQLAQAVAATKTVDKSKEKLALGKADETSEQVIMARRLIAERCLYGVDINPMAVEMAKLSLWLITMQKNRPFSFLNHALKCGDSLLGVTQLQQLADFNLQAVRQLAQAQTTPINEQSFNAEQNLSEVTTASVNVASANETAKSMSATEAINSMNATVDNLFLYNILQPILNDAVAKRQQLETLSSNSIAEILQKEKLLAEAETTVTTLRLVADLLVGQALKADELKSKTAQRDKTLIAQRIYDTLQQVSAQISASDDPDDAVLNNAALAALRQETAQLLESRKPFHWLLEFPEVFLKPDDNNAKGGAESLKLGFDAIIGNPPFIGGQRITGTLGTDYRDFLIRNIGRNKRGSSDLSAYFLLRSAQLLQNQGGFGLLATNTIAQGDTREVGLDQLVADGFTINRAISSRRWPGTASLEVSYVWARKGSWQGEYVLDDEVVAGITPLLTVPGKATGKPYSLKANENKSFVGSSVLGMGFIMTPETAQQLIAKNPRNADVLFPYLNGEDLNSRHDQSASRWVINFKDWPLDRESAPDGYVGPVAADYPDCLDIVRETVKPERDKNNRKQYQEKWWHYAEKRPKLYATISGMEKVLVVAQTSSTVAFSFVTRQQVFSNKIIVFVMDQYQSFAVIQSSFHGVWAWKYSSTMKTDLSYTPSDSFQTFPFPQSLDSLEDIGARYYNQRQAIMAGRQEGLTKTYNRFHNPDYNEDIDAEIVELRKLQIEMDYAVAQAYGWTDLQLAHDFYETKQGRRFTISEAARQEVLDRLLALNHERYAAEVAAGLHDTGKKASKTSVASKKTSSNSRKASNNNDSELGVTTAPLLMMGINK
jgi:hypothetical protein